MATKRLASIDILRALTMFLMIFVNDLWTLSDYPKWLGHTLAHEDGMGLADVVFPAFLFIVGLSIPLAIQARRKKGDGWVVILAHIAVRTVALLVMGFFMVNLENIDKSNLLIAKELWQILMIVSFVLIWNHYQDRKVWGIDRRWFQALGVLILIFLAVIYHGGTTDQPTGMRPYWWGILGLIGWGYLVCAILYLFSKDRIWLVAIFLGTFIFLNAQESLWDNSIELVVSAAIYSMVMAGVLITLILQYFMKRDKLWILVGSLLVLGALFLLFGFWTRGEWEISKIRSTPSWATICIGISLWFFIIIYLLADRLNFTRWAKPLAPAGRSTLTCYLVPYVAYALMGIFDWQAPEIFTQGLVGILKSLLFAYIIIFITGLLEKVNIKLKI